VIEVADPALPPPDAAEQDFLRKWRAELLSRAWQALERREAESGRPLYQTLRLRVEHPSLRCRQLADLLSSRLGKEVTADGYRQTLHRAREAFAGLLLEEVARSLEDRAPQAVEQELADLGLLEYCRPALARSGGDS
jgi:RNA polymerase sigma-70 factor (ECF subfamily)